jgi:two-component system cell cycle response regulator DivK
MPSEEKYQKQVHAQTIMIVEDYDDTRLLLRHALEAKGYRVLEAINGQEAVEISMREHPVLILMDLDLPILDGIAATQRIRQQSEMSQVPIIAVTAYPMSYTRVKAFAQGCNGYMSKPIDLSELQELITRHLSGGEPPVHSG